MIQFGFYPTKNKQIVLPLIFILVLIRYLDSFTPRPIYAHLFNEQGMEALKKNHVTKAQHFFHKALHHDPLYYESTYQLALLEKNPEAQKHLFSQLVNYSIETGKYKIPDKKPHFADPLYLIGLDYYQKKDYVNAIKYFRKSAFHNDNNKNRNTFYYLGLSAHAIGNRSATLNQIIHLHNLIEPELEKELGEKTGLKWNSAITD